MKGRWRRHKKEEETKPRGSKAIPLVGCGGCDKPKPRQAHFSGPGDPCWTRARGARGVPGHPWTALNTRWFWSRGNQGGHKLPPAPHTLQKLQASAAPSEWSTVVPGWLRLAIDSQNKARNRFVSTIKTCDLDSVTIQHPILNIKSGFPQNMILGHLFSVLRASDLQKGWDSEGRGDFFKKKNI